jgi:hypothetical protein
MKWWDSLSDEDKRLAAEAQEKVSEAEKLDLFWEVQEGSHRRTLEVRPPRITKEMIGQLTPDRLEYRQNRKDRRLPT